MGNLVPNFKNHKNQTALTEDGGEQRGGQFSENRGVGVVIFKNIPLAWHNKIERLRLSFVALVNFKRFMMFSFIMPNGFAYIYDDDKLSCYFTIGKML